MTTPPNTPRVFISYSWTSPDHLEWVVQLAEKLCGDGIDVILDQWDLKEGHDKYHFMEQMVSDPDVGTVLAISDQLYAEKADGRKGGVGTETQIISKEIYESTKQEKFVPIVRERDDDGKECLPVFLQTRKYIDFSDDDKFGESYDQLVRNIYGRPERVKPSLGKAPPHFFADTITTVSTAGKLTRLIDAVQRGKPFTQAILQEYLDTFIVALEDYRLTYDRTESTPFDDIVPTFRK